MNTPNRTAATAPKQVTSYRDGIAQMRNQASPYFTYFHAITELAGNLLDGLFLQFLMNLWDISRKSTDGYFACSHKKLGKFGCLGWKRRVTDTRFQSLAANQTLRPFVRIEVRGSPPRRHVWLDIPGIFAAVGIDCTERGNRLHGTGELDDENVDSPEISQLHRTGESEGRLHGTGESIARNGGIDCTERGTLLVKENLTGSPKSSKENTQTAASRPGTVVVPERPPPSTVVSPAVAAPRTVPFRPKPGEPPLGPEVVTRPPLKPGFAWVAKEGYVDWPDGTRRQNGYFLHPNFMTYESRQKYPLDREPEPEVESTPPIPEVAPSTPPKPAPSAPRREAVSPPPRVIEDAAPDPDEPFGALAPKATADGRRRARKLRDAGVAAGISHPFSESKWAVTFDRLAAEVGADRLDAALDYHCDHIADEFALQIYSADTFRRRFAEVERKLDRDRKRGKAAIPPDPAADELVRRVVEDHCGGHEPPGMSDAIRLSWANQVAWLAKVRVAAGLDAGERRILVELSGELYLALWFKEAWAKNRKWTEWGGSWAGNVWRADHPKFQAAAHRELARYGTNPKKVMESLTRMTPTEA